MKKIDHIINKIVVIFEKKNSVLTIAMKFHLKNTIKADITVEIPVAFLNGFKNDYRFLIKELAEKCRKMPNFYSSYKKRT